MNQPCVSQAGAVDRRMDMQRMREEDKPLRQEEEEQAWRVLQVTCRQAVCSRGSRDGSQQTGLAQLLLGG